MSEEKPTDIEMDMIESRLEDANAGKNIRATAMDTATPRTDAEVQRTARISATSGSEQAWEDMCYVAKELERELIASAELVARLEAALRQSVEVIKQWHNMDGSDDVWTIYYENAPEIQPIRQALKGQP